MIIVFPLLLSSTNKNSGIRERAPGNPRPPTPEQTLSFPRVTVTTNSVFACFYVNLGCRNYPYPVVLMDVSISPGCYLYKWATDKHMFSHKIKKTLSQLKESMPKYLII